MTIYVMFSKDTWIQILIQNTDPVGHRIRIQLGSKTLNYHLVNHSANKKKFKMGVESQFSN